MAVPYILKRTTVASRSPTTSDIVSGQLAINLTDQKLFCSNGTGIFEVGSNLSSLSVGSIKANGSFGSVDQILTSNGSAAYWGTPSSVVYGDGACLLNYNEQTTSSLSQVVVDTFSSTTFRSANYQIQLNDIANTSYQITSISLIHNGSTTFLSETGTISTSSNLGIFNADVNAGNVRLLLTPTIANTKVRISRTAISI